MSPRGLSRIKQSKQEADARRAAYDAAGPAQRRLIIKDGETVRVRPLEQGDEVWSVYIHQLPAPPGKNFGDAILCLDQDNSPEANCPACNRSIKRSERVTINVIWFNAPRWKKGKDGKALKDANDDLIYDGVEDVVATWNTSVTNGGRLEYLQEILEKQHNVSGITNAIMTVKREGQGKESKYQIDIAEVVDPKPHEIDLFKSKPDPRDVIKKLSRGDMERVFSGGGMPSGSSAPSETSDNAFERAAANPSSRGAFGGTAPPEEQPKTSTGINANAFG